MSPQRGTGPVQPHGHEACADIKFFGKISDGLQIEVPADKQHTGLWIQFHQECIYALLQLLGLPTVFRAILGRDASFQFRQEDGAFSAAPLAGIKLKAVDSDAAGNATDVSGIVPGGIWWYAVP